VQEVIATLELLIQGLSTKRKRLQSIHELTKAQQALLVQETFDMKSFNKLLKKKQEDINQVVQIDEGFAETYKRIQKQIMKHPKMYAEYIRSMQSELKIISDLSIEITVLEERNNLKFKEVSKGMKEYIRSFRTNKKSVTNYYKNYNKQQESVRDRFFDSQK